MGKLQDGSKPFGRADYFILSLPIPASQTILDIVDKKFIYNLSRTMIVQVWIGENDSTILSPSLSVLSIGNYFRLGNNKYGQHNVKEIIDF